MRKRGSCPLAEKAGNWRKVEELAQIRQIRENWVLRTIESATTEDVILILNMFGYFTNLRNFFFLLTFFFLLSLFFCCLPLYLKNLNLGFPSNCFIIFSPLCYIFFIKYVLYFPLIIFSFDSSFLQFKKIFHKNRWFKKHHHWLDSSVPRFLLGTTKII